MGSAATSPNVRLSVSDRCDLRCVYCMSEDIRFLPRGHDFDLAAKPVIFRHMNATGG